MTSENIVGLEIFRASTPLVVLVWGNEKTLVPSSRLDLCRIVPLGGFFGISYVKSI